MTESSVQKTARIQDVAKAAGVSTATVSRALSKPDLLSETTREAVFAAIRATGYRVNRAARNLRTQRAGAVLVLVPNLGNPFFSRILSGLSEGFADSEYSVLILDTNHIGAGHRGLVDYFLDGRVDGMVSLDGGVPAEAIGLFAQNGMLNRIVCACEWIAGADLPSVRSDNHHGAQLAIRHLHALGHRNIAHVTGPEDNVLTHERRNGMLEERARLSLPARPEWVIRGDFSLASGQEAAARIAAMDDRPTAVFCASDEVAFGLISGLTQRGISVPGDISVVGFDDIELAAHFIPGLTTVRQDRRGLGLAAAAMLLERLTDGADAAPRATIRTLDMQMVERASTAPPRA